MQTQTHFRRASPFNTALVKQIEKSMQGTDTIASDLSISDKRTKYQKQWTQQSNI